MYFVLFRFRRWACDGRDSGNRDRGVGRYNRSDPWFLVLPQEMSKSTKQERPGGGQTCVSTRYTSLPPPPSPSLIYKNICNFKWHFRSYYIRVLTCSFSL